MERRGEGKVEGEGEGVRRGEVMGGEKKGEVRCEGRR